jgi:GNAT superfamily N-acetyltransferase
MTTADTRIRMATVADVDIIVGHRRRMFQEMGCQDDAALDAMQATSSVFLRDGLQDGSYVGWLAECEGLVVAGGGVVVVGYPSTPRDRTARRAWILNMYTEPNYRRRGLAKLILEAMILWCRHHGFGWVSLHASDAGRHLYESLGFRPTNEMLLALR